MTDQKGTPERAAGLIEGPPDHVVAAAIGESIQSPCRSKRGVAIFDQEENVVTSAHNYKPRSFACDGSAACKATCRTEAIHAEQQTLLYAGRKSAGCDLVHVKTVDGQLVPSGPPSCVPCSKLILVANIVGVWLYHADGWRRYDAVEFHRLSLEALEQASQPVVSLMERHPFRGQIGGDRCLDCGEFRERGNHSAAGAKNA